MNLKPLGDHLILQPLSEEDRSGIALPESEKEKKSGKGEVIAVGPGRVLDNGNRLPMSIKVGDKIMYRSYAGDEIKSGEKKYLIISESDVLVKPRTQITEHRKCLLQKNLLLEFC